MIWYIASSIALGIAGLMVYIYYLNKGQFDDPEEVKYQLFHQDDE